jgi:hypothetical protein
MAGSFKRIAAKSITNHTAHKEYDVQLVGGSGSFDGVEVFGYEGIYGKSEYTSGSESLTTNGFTKRDIHSAVVAPFYRPKFTDGYFAPRGWDDTIQVISIPALMSGDSIKPGSFTLVSSSVTVYDDGEGRLLDSTFQNYVSSSINEHAFSANVSAHYDLKQVKQTITEYTNKTYTQNARGTFYNVLPTSGTIDFVDPIPLPTDFLQTTASFISITRPTGTDQTEDWKNTTFPSSSFVWIDKLPRDTSYNNNFTGLSFYFRAKLIKTAGASNTVTILQIGPSDSQNTNNTFMRIFWSESTYRLGLQWTYNGSLNSTIIATSVGQNPLVSGGDTISVAVRLQADGTWASSVKNHTDNSAVTSTTGTNTRLPELRLYNPEDRAMTIGCGWSYKDPDLSQYTAVTVPDPVPNDKLLHHFSSLELYEFDLWTTDIGSDALSALVVERSEQVGNIFYEEGIAAITSKLSTYWDFYKSANVGFKNSVNLTEHEYVCMISDQEFNMTQNPSILSDDSTAENPKIQGYVSSSNWDPYITTIGLYDKNYTLMAIGRLGRPLRKVEHYDQTFVVRWDT